jgi:tetratricopeptide (TPR) repeat protein
VKKSVAALLIAVAVAATYAPAVRDGFVWDDTALVLRDPLIRSWRLIPEGFNHFLFVDATASDFYRPLQRLTYTIEYAAFAFQPAGYHVTNILLHAAAAIALFFFAEELLLAFAIESRKRRLIALIATLVWAVHPVQSSAVIYVSGRADPLAAAFGFLGCYLILLGVRAMGTRVLLYLVAADAALLLSALSKEMGLIFLAVPLALFAVVKNWTALWKAALIALFVAIFYLSLRMPAEHIPPPPERDPTPLAIRPINIARAFAEYASLIVFPINLHMERQLNAPPIASADADMSPPARRELQTLTGLILFAAAIFWAIRSRKRNRFVFTGLILAAIGYLPISGVITLNAAVAEHWIYLPSAFLFLAATAAILDLIERVEGRRVVRIAASAAFAVWVVFLGLRTFIRTFDWRDQRTFLERTIASGGDSARMLINLGGLELTEGRLDLAKKNLTAALQKEPDQSLAIINLAALAVKQNDFKTARELLKHATQLPVVDAQAHELLAVLENKEHGRADLLRLRLASRTGSPDWSIERRYIKLLEETGAMSNAIGEIQNCLQMEWYRAETWQLFSRLLAKAGHEKEAAAALARARAYDVHLDSNQNAL